MIQPGSTIGILGSGQLGRMSAFAAQRLGYYVHVYSPESESPAGQVATSEYTGAYDDTDALLQFARHVDVVTYEFENIPVDALQTVERLTPVYPSAHVLQTTQNRLREKMFLQQHGLPVTSFCQVRSQTDVHQFMTRDQTVRPVIVKTATSGYDGHGQMRLDAPECVTQTLPESQSVSAVAEDLVDFELELSVIGVRSQSGEFCSFGPIINDHSDHILDVSVTPSGELSKQQHSDAVEITRCILESLDVTGVLTVEMFLTTSGQLLVNELAPRPHNSGHLTIEAAQTSQFEQQVRCVCGLPAGSMQQLQPAAMANLLGQHLSDTPDWGALANQPDVHWHLYGKRRTVPGRKMGHLTATADSPRQAELLVRGARQQLSGSRQRTH